MICKSYKALYYILIVLTLGALWSCSGIAPSEKSFVDRLLAEMTLEEKIGQMNMYSGFFDPTGPAPVESQEKAKYKHIKQGLVGAMLNVRGAKTTRELQKLAVDHSRLGIPMLFGYDVIHGHKTMMPIPLAEAASWDLDLIEKSARVAAVEATSEGIHWTFAPMVDISRDARWGRVMEGAGEDPYLGCKVASARVRGFQGTSLADSNTLASCAKHFAGYGFVQAGREYNSVDIGTSTLWNVVFPPFLAAIDEGVATFMNAFNEVNGIPSTGDTWLQKTILKGHWAFPGFVVSDWGTVKELITHGFAENGPEAVEKAIKAGCDMDMESHLFVQHLKGLVEDGKVDVSAIDNAVRRILSLKKDLGLFEDPYRYCDEERQARWINHPEHHEVALEMAKKSIVLLKNQSLLPLDSSGLKISVIGPLANSKNSPLGNWRLAADDNSAVSLLEGLEKYSGNEYQYTQGVSLWSGEEVFYKSLDVNNVNTSGLKDAISIAQSSDVVLMVLGEHALQSGEGRSRTRLGLPGLQQELLEAVYEVNPNIVLVLMNGRPLALPWAADNIPSILETWHLGSQSGNAIAATLYGENNPSGKLPMTFPRGVGQVPIYYNHKRTGRPEGGNDVFWSHYIDEKNTPLWPFGHGLSYSSFEYTDLNIAKTQDSIEITVNVKNTSGRSGEEVVHLFVRDPVASVTRPVKELKGFKKISLGANQEEKVRFILTKKELGFYDLDGNWRFEAGRFNIIIDHLAMDVHFDG